jgi:hypothetical protein
MKNVLIALAALPFMVGAAVAGQPTPQPKQLNDKQMDKVTAGFDANAWADAQGLVGESGILQTYTATLAVVAPYARSTLDEGSSTLYKSVSAAQSWSAAATYKPSGIPAQTP